MKPQTPQNDFFFPKGVAFILLQLPQAMQVHVHAEQIVSIVVFFLPTDNASSQQSSFCAALNYSAPKIPPDWEKFPICRGHTIFTVATQPQYNTCTNAQKAHPSSAWSTILQPNDKSYCCALQIRIGTAAYRKVSVNICVSLVRL